MLVSLQVSSDGRLSVHHLVIVSGTYKESAQILAPKKCLSIS